MNNLFKHIEYLLLHHDCVIVPCFGAFIATNVPARIDYERKEIVPPTRVIMFNQAVSTEDGLLASSYVRKSGITFDEARQIILREVALLKNSLSINDKVKVGNIGTLSLGQEGNIIFMPLMDTANCASLLGFNSVGFLKFANKKISEEYSVSADAGSIEGLSTGTEFNKAGHFHDILKKRKIFSRIAASVLLVAVVVLTIILHPLPSDNREQRASVVPVEALLSTKNISVNRHDSTKIIPEEAPVVEEVSLPSHYLIVATFRSAEDANVYVEKYSSESYPLVTVPSKKVTRVAVASSNDKGELLERLKSAPIHSRFPNAWIWTRI